MGNETIARPMPSFFAIGLLSALIGATSATADPALEPTSIGGIESEHTASLARFLAKLTAAPNSDPYREGVHLDENGIGLLCFAHPKDQYRIGVAQYYSIDASVAAIAQVLRNFDGYSRWFDGLVAARAEKKDDNHYLVGFEQSVPIPFVANVRYQMNYAMKSDAGREIFLYQLASGGGSLNSYDGFILIEKVDENRSYVTEIDFIDAQWGIAKIQGQAAIWSESLVGIYQTDLAVKIRAEKPDLSDKDVLQFSRKKAKARDWTECLEHKKAFGD